MENFFKYLYVDFGFKIIGKFSMISKKYIQKKSPPALHNF